ncbi:MAG: type II secretion system secretin GspD [Desulfobacteraceae bacterium]|nr:type II secretion system secretin GspD [Desulfobacteraceae bacterium]MBC2750032.1 type II secretion system secretin GspD [Desulfobacteraceae bacterium]
MRRKSGGIPGLILSVLVAMVWGVAGCATPPIPVGGQAEAIVADSAKAEPRQPAADPVEAGNQAEAPKTAPSLPAASAVTVPEPARQGTGAPLTAGSVGEPPTLTPGVPPSGDAVQPPPYYAGALIPVANDDAAGAQEKSMAAGSEGTIEINFDNADLIEVIRTLADILNIQYLLDPGVQGSVTIHTAGGMARENLFPLFFKILEVNGLTAIKDGPLFRITPTSDASRLPIMMGRSAGMGDQTPPGERVMIQIIPLKHISAGEMSKLLVPFASEGATIVAHQATNTLVVVDKGDNILKILKIAATFDIGLFERVEHRFYLLENAQAKETASMLQEIFGARGDNGTVRFIPIERLNAVLALSADPRVFTKADQFMIQLDAKGEGVEPRIYVYFVKNGGAEELAGLLNTTFGSGAGPDSRVSFGEAKFRFSRNPFALKPKVTVTPEAQTPQAPETPAAGELMAAPRSDISIIPDPVRNALLIQSTPADYRIISNILAQIDVLPRQVLIEATIAEISLDDRFELGVEWEYTRERTSNDTGLLSGTINGDGLSYAIAFSQDLLHNLNTLAANNKVNILSSPHVLASDGKEAKIDVSNEIPIISSETVISSSAEPLVTTDIQYRDTGVLLSVTPHINENGLVTMAVYQEVSEQGEDVNVAGENYPSFFKRSVDTTLTVKDDQTIVLGGLIRENKGQNRSGVPGLIDIPGLGWLFGSRDDTYDKAELIILLTPRVITSLDDVQAVTEEFEEKVGETMQYIREKQQSTYYNP